MKVAIVGAGLSGLAVCYYLLQLGCTAHVFDAKGVGGGASGIAGGLLHPYPGEEGKRSLYADEALFEARALFQEVGIKPQEGILRVPRSDVERQTLRKTLLLHGDVEESESGFFIKSGMTVHVPRYLELLWKACEERGGKLYIRHIEALGDLEDYDQIIVAAGAGSILFDECKNLKVSLRKGQVLLASYPKGMRPLEQSRIAKGYIAVSEEGCILGSTYEREFTSSEPDMDKAKQEILPKIARFFSEVENLAIDACKAGVRLSRQGHYFPYAEKITSNKWLLTAMGSRGLLYHAYLGKRLAQAVSGRGY